MLRFFVIAILFWVGWLFFNESVILQSPGILVSEDPILVTSPNSLVAWKRDNYTITPLATYHIKARVLSKNHYYMGRETDLSYYDLVLGWKEMSDTKVLNSIEISQSYRWYSYTVKNNLNERLIDPSLIQFESGNMHIIADNNEVLEAIKKIKVGNVIILDGYLVDIVGSDGWHWKSSITASSSGAHGCKLIWVNKVEISPLTT